MGLFRKLFGGSSSEEKLEQEGKMAAEIAAKVTGNRLHEQIPKLIDSISTRIMAGLSIAAARRCDDGFSTTEMTWILGYIVGYSSCHTELIGGKPGSDTEINITLGTVQNLFPDDSEAYYELIFSYMRAGGSKPPSFVDGMDSGYDDSAQVITDIKKGDKGKSGASRMPGRVFMRKMVVEYEN